MNRTKVYADVFATILKLKPQQISELISQVVLKLRILLESFLFSTLYRMQGCEIVRHDISKYLKSYSLHWIHLKIEW